MTEPIPVPVRPERVADVLLRGPAGRQRARVRWPVALPAAAAPALVVLLRAEGPLTTGALPLDAALVVAVAVAVLTTAPTSVAEALATVEWAADHATELGADPDRLVVAGEGPSARQALAVARAASAGGWPPIERILLVDPEGEPEPAPPGWAHDLAPVCVVGGGGTFVRALRDGGAEVTEVTSGALADLPLGPVRR